MILRSIGPDAPFYRALAPRWAHAPESGAGGLGRMWHEAGLAAFATAKAGGWLLARR
jgi:hypothetical protein